MKEKTYQVFTFAELSREAKDRAKQEHFDALGYSWTDEAMDSINALAKHFDGKMSDWEIDWTSSSYSSARFDMPDMEPEEIESRLASLGSFNPETLKGNGDCKLTGYCMDEDAIDGFRKAFHDDERDLSKLMQSAFGSWIKSAQADYAAQWEDENFAEMSEANGYEYEASGRLD